MIYDINVQWLAVDRRGNCGLRTRWVRGIEAASLTDAYRVALAGFAGKINPGVSMGWAVWPQPRRA